MRTALHVLVWWAVLCAAGTVLWVGGVSAAKAHGRRQAERDRRWSR